MRSDKIIDAAAPRIVALGALGRLVFMRGCFVFVFDVLGILFFLAWSYPCGAVANHRAMILCEFIIYVMCVLVLLQCFPHRCFVVSRFSKSSLVLRHGQRT